MDSRTAATIAHDIGLAAWFGGSWMGAYAMNAATREVHDHTQRTRVANAGWFRWAPVVAMAIPSHLVSAYLLGRFGGGGRLRWIRAVVTAAALVATIETGRSGRAVVLAGDVPVATAVEPIAETPIEVAAAQRRLRIAQWAVPVFTGLMWVVDGLQQDRRTGV
jgi:hypothetical protein